MTMTEIGHSPDELVPNSKSVLISEALTRGNK